MRSRRGPAIVLITLFAGTLASAEGRDAAIRISVQAGQRATDGKTESILDVQEILQRRQPDSVLAYAPTGAPAELVLWITRRYTTSSPQASGRQETSFRCVIDGLVVDPERGQQRLSGAGVIWHKAATELVDALAAHAQERQHELLRKRPDWPDLGFEFEALTKERRKQLGAKDGQVFVATVRPDGPAEKAGLQGSDVILAVGDRKLKTTADLARILYLGVPSAEVALQVTRGGTRRTVTIAIP